MVDTNILIKKVEEKKLSSKANEELVQRITLYIKDSINYKVT